MLKKLFCLLGLHSWENIDTRRVRFKNRRREVINSGLATLQKCANCDKKRAWLEDMFGEVVILSAALHEAEIKAVDSNKKVSWITP